MPEPRDALCAKVSYPNRSHAENVMYRTWRRADHRPKPVRAYQCPRCQLWHLTSQPLSDYLTQNGKAA